jgi:L-fuconolactonase
MKIDTHQHYWHYHAQDYAWITADMPALRQDRQPPDVLPAMQAAGMDAAVAVQARSMPQETDYLLSLAHAHPHIVGVVGWTDLCAPGIADTLDGYADEPMLKGFRHILQGEPQLPALLRQPDFNRGVQAVQARGLVYEVLVFDRQIPVVLDFCGRHDTHWLVLDHLGKPCLRDWSRPEVPSRWLACMRTLAAMPHMLCKLSGLVTETSPTPGDAMPAQDAQIMLECFDQALELFGPHRLLFGSDWPVCQLAAPYGVVHSLAQHWASTRLTRQEQDAFWGGNAQRCYQLNSAPAPSGH